MVRLFFMGHRSRRATWVQELTEPAQRSVPDAGAADYLKWLRQEYILPNAQENPPKKDKPNTDDINVCI